MIGLSLGEEAAHSLVLIGTEMKQFRARIRNAPVINERDSES